jgi:hypothetical protein
VYNANFQVDIDLLADTLYVSTGAGNFFSYQVGEPIVFQKNGLSNTTKTGTLSLIVSDGTDSYSFDSQYVIVASGDFGAYVDSENNLTNFSVIATSDAGYYLNGVAYGPNLVYTPSEGEVVTYEPVVVISDRYINSKDTIISYSFTEDPNNQGQYIQVTIYNGTGGIIYLVVQ